MSVLQDSFYAHLAIFEQIPKNLPVSVNYAPLESRNDSYPCLVVQLTLELCPDFD